MTDALWENIFEVSYMKRDKFDNAM